MSAALDKVTQVMRKPPSERSQAALCVVDVLATAPIFKLPGEEIYKAGSTIDRCYVILSGAVSCSALSVRLKTGEAFPPIDLFMREGLCRPKYVAIDHTVALLVTRTAFRRTRVFGHFKTILDRLAAFRRVPFVTSWGSDATLRLAKHCFTVRIPVGHYLTKPGDSQNQFLFFLTKGHARLLWAARDEGPRVPFEALSHVVESDHVLGSSDAVGAARLLAEADAIINHRTEVRQRKQAITHAPASPTTPSTTSPKHPTPDQGLTKKPSAGSMARSASPSRRGSHRSLGIVDNLPFLDVHETVRPSRDSPTEEFSENEPDSDDDFVVTRLPSEDAVIADVMADTPDAIPATPADVKYGKVAATRRSTLIDPRIRLQTALRSSSVGSSFAGTGATSPTALGTVQGPEAAVVCCGPGVLEAIAVPIQALARSISHRPKAMYDLVRYVKKYAMTHTDVAALAENDSRRRDAAVTALQRLYSQQYEERPNHAFSSQVSARSSVSSAESPTLVPSQSSSSLASAGEKLVKLHSPIASSVSPPATYRSNTSAAVSTGFPSRHARSSALSTAGVSAISPVGVTHADDELFEIDDERTRMELHFPTQSEFKERKDRRVTALNTAQMQDAAARTRSKLAGVSTTTAERGSPTDWLSAAKGYQIQTNFARSQSPSRGVVREASISEFIESAVKPSRTRSKSPLATSVCSDDSPMSHSSSMHDFRRRSPASDVYTPPALTAAVRPRSGSKNTQKAASFVSPVSRQQSFAGSAADDDDPVLSLINIMQQARK